MLITEFLIALEKVVPLTAVGYDRDAVGLQIGLPNETELKRAIFAYETTTEVIVEAKKEGANCIVAFHPLIFPTVNAITDRTRTGSLIRELVKNDIALYIQHTAFDTNLNLAPAARWPMRLGCSRRSCSHPLRLRTPAWG